MSTLKVKAVATPTYAGVPTALTLKTDDLDRLVVAANGSVDANGTLRVTGSVAPTTGAGIEILYSTLGTIQAYDRSAGAWKDLYYSGLSHTWRANNTEAAKIDSAGIFYFNSGYGSPAKAYGCRAWVNFNGTGTVAIRASGNVSSITDNGVGDYTVNFATAMVDANYAVSTSQTQYASGNNAGGGLQLLGNPATLMSTTQVRLASNYGAGSITDTANATVSIFR